MSYQFCLSTNTSILFGAFDIYSGDSQSVTFPNTTWYGGVFERSSCIYFCTNKGGVYNIYIVSGNWSYLVDQISGAVWNRVVLSVDGNSSKPTTTPVLPPIVKTQSSDSIQGLIGVVSKMYQLTLKEEKEFRVLLDEEKIRTRYAVQQTSTKEIEQIPHLYPYRKMYGTLSVMVNQKSEPVGKVQTLGSSYQENSGKIWEVTSSNSEIFDLHNTTDNRTANGFYLHNYYVSQDVFWILFHNSPYTTDEALGGVTTDNYNTMPLSNNDTLTKYT